MKVRITRVENGYIVKTDSERVCVFENENTLMKALIGETLTLMPAGQTVELYANYEN